MQTFGKGIAERYMIPYNTKIWKCPPEKMDTFWVDGRVPKPPVEDIIKSAVGIQTEGYTHQLNFGYPEKGGFQCIPDAFFNEVKEKVSLNFHIKKIHKKNNKWIVSDGVKEKEFDKIISTVPIFALRDAMELEESTKNAISSLRYNSIIMVLLGFDEKNPGDKHWLYIPEMTTPTHRLIYLKNYTKYSSPEGKTSIISEITFNEGDEISKMSDDEILQKIIDDLDKMSLIDKTKICYKKVCRTKYAYVVYALEYKEAIKKIYEHFSSVGIHLCGRFSQFVYINSDGCIRNAKSVTDTLIKEIGKTPKEIKDMMYNE